MRSLTAYTDHLNAAKALSAHLNSLGARHAYIGGFALAMIGSIRSTEMSIYTLTHIRGNPI
ncbi:hypothetical protein BV20DRAFT_659080 [Pilatotrama ljubarskyi]|nr:hypothetical protein BV20DRAFT_659080 [Pilatotrama ljubarskyi]